MIELLILYTLRNHEKTIYAVRRDIIEIFGNFTVPSIGTIHPAMKRLEQKGCLTCTERMSEGGKKSSYYKLTQKGRDFFKELFFTDLSENPSLFYGHLQARFGTLSMLEVEDRKKFVSDISKKLEMYSVEVEDKLNDEFITLDYFQKSLLKRTLNEINSLKTFVKNLKVDHDS